MEKLTGQQWNGTFEPFVRGEDQDVHGDYLAMRMSADTNHLAFLSYFCGYADWLQGDLEGPPALGA